MARTGKSGRNVDNSGQTFYVSAEAKRIFRLSALRKAENYPLVVIINTHYDR